MSALYKVTATLLNVRRTPGIQPLNIIGKLGQGEIAERVDDEGPDWFHIRTASVEGFAAAKFLELTVAPGAPTPELVRSLAPAAPPAPAPRPAFQPAPANFPRNARAKLTSTEMRHCPLADLPIRPHRDGQSPDNRCAELHQIVADLNVANSARYAPTTQTFCNIYAYDFCFLAGVYLPRVWWTSKALLAMAGGETQPVIYDKTVRELTANDLHRWMGDWGSSFGWRACTSVEDLQSSVNNGGLGAITAQRVDLSRSGHITVVIPENAQHSALRQAASIVAPLQSQAGRTNKPFFASRWWLDLVGQFRATGLWVNE